MQERDREALKKGWSRRPWKERQWKERNDSDEKILESLRQAGEEYQAALTAGERLREYSGRIGLLAEELGQYGQERKKLEAARERYRAAGEESRQGRRCYPGDVPEIPGQPGGNPGFTAHRRPALSCMRLCHSSGACTVSGGGKRGSQGQGRPA